VPYILLVANLIQELKDIYSYHKTTHQLIAANVMVYLLIAIPLVIIEAFLPQANVEIMVLHFLAVPAHMPTLLRQPWSLVTSLFYHQGVMHLLFNMLWLFVFGNILENFLGNKKAIPLFIYGGFSGSLLYILCYNTLPLFKPEVAQSYALGASAGVMAIVAAAATIAPTYSIQLIFLGAVQLRYIALIVFLLDFLNITKGNAGGHIAHLGGALFGYIFIVQLQKGNDWSTGFNRLFTIVLQLFKPKPILRKVYTNKNYTSVQKKSGAGIAQVENQKRTDEILDKISSSGYESLSKEEKEFLFKISKE
jgi:membrane associated rhomboid family serine protease